MTSTSKTLSYRLSHLFTQTVSLSWTAGMLFINRQIVRQVLVADSQRGNTGTQHHTLNTGLFCRFHHIPRPLNIDLKKRLLCRWYCCIKCRQVNYHISINHRGFKTFAIENIRLNLINVTPTAHLVEIAYIKILGHKRRAHITTQFSTPTSKENAIHS